MPRRGRPMPPLVLTAEETDTPRAVGAAPDTAQALALRARIVLLRGAGMANDAVARRAHVTRQTVGRWRRAVSRRAARRLAR